MSVPFVILRRALAANAMDVIARAYPDQLAEIQKVVSGDGAVLTQIRWSAMTPEFEFAADGFPQAYKSQRVILELQARCDYTDRMLDARFLLLCQVFEDFIAWGQPGASQPSNLKDVLTSAEATGVVVQSVTPQVGTETIEDSDFVVTYRLLCLVCGK